MRDNIHYSQRKSIRKELNSKSRGYTLPPQEPAEEITEKLEGVTLQDAPEHLQGSQGDSNPTEDQRPQPTEQTDSLPAPEESTPEETA